VHFGHFEKALTGPRREFERWLVVHLPRGVEEKQAGAGAATDDVRGVDPYNTIAGLAGLLLVALSWGRRPRLRDVVAAFGITMLYALSDEWHQSFVPDRAGRLDDVVTDAIGATIGLVVAWIVLTWAARRGAAAEQPAGS